MASVIWYAAVLMLGGMTGTALVLGFKSGA